MVVSFARATETHKKEKPRIDTVTGITDTNFLSNATGNGDRKCIWQKDSVCVTGTFLSSTNPQERRPQEYVWLLVLDSNWLVDRVQPVSNPGLRVTHSWGTSFLLGGIFSYCTRLVMWCSRARDRTTWNMKLEPQKISSIKCVVSLRPRTTILYTISLGFMFHCFISSCRTRAQEWLKPAFTPELHVTNLMLTQVIQVRRLGSQAPSYLNYLCQH